MARRSRAVGAANEAPTGTGGDEPAGVIASTVRTTLRELHGGDAPFILALLNDPDWLRNIGDRKIRDEAAARAYIESGPAAMYARHGFGLWKVERRDDGVAMGLCGLIRRPTLTDVDIGFAFLPPFRRAGYAAEAAAACLELARGRFGLRRVVAIVSPGNVASIGLIEKLGLRYEQMLAAAPGDDVKLYGINW